MRCSALLVLVLTACATYSQFMVHPSGQTAMCQAHGSGLLGTKEARHIQERCQASLRAAGYIEIERAGVIGVAISDSLVVVRVMPGSPADSVGIAPGDRISTIDRQPVHDRATLQLLLFGPPETVIDIQALRRQEMMTFHPRRKPYPVVFGTPAPPR